MKNFLRKSPLFAIVSTLTLTGCGFSFSSADASASSSMGESTSVPARNRLLHVEGSDVLNADGEKIYLRGTNVGGLFVQESWMCFTESRDQLNTYNVIESLYGEGAAFEALDVYENSFFIEEDFQNCQDLGLNVLRLPISYMDVYDTDFSVPYLDSPTAAQLRGLTLTLREKHLGKIDKFIQDAERHGLYVILDLHGAWGSQNGNDHSIDARQHDWLWNKDEMGEAFRELTLRTWQDLARRYKDYANIAGYDLLNEPAGDNSAGLDNTTTTGKQQWDYFDTLYKAIRAIDQNHIIIMESCWDASNLPNPTAYGWENIIYQYHHYEWSGQDDDELQFASHSAKVKNLVDADYGVPIYMGEFRVFGSEENETLARVLSLYNSNNLHWTTWSYKVRGWSNWGLYCVPTWGEHHPERARIKSLTECDDFFDILNKWENQRIGQAKNEAMCDVIKAALNQEGAKA